MNESTLHRYGNTGGVFIRTFGCQMNEYDSERMMGLLLLAGYEPVNYPEKADIIIINTCSIREKPEEKTYSEIGTYRLLKEKNPQLIIVVSGCVAQQRAGDIIDRFPYVDLILGTGQINRIDELIAEIREGRKAAVEIEFADNPHIRKFPRISERYSAFVTIMQGCDNYCSYCIVPYVRGREMSRPSDEVVSEVRQLIDEGFIEVTLLGQNVNSYRDPGKGLTFSLLIDRVAEINGIKRIRFTTSHPKDLSDDLIDRFRTTPHLCSHIHLPIQSGSDKVLESMNRRYTRDQYLDKVRALKAARPDISITTDIIVGFPGETRSDFNDTLSLMEEVVFDGAFSFKYSPRPGTKAALMADNVDDREKAERLFILQELQKKHTLMRNKNAVNGVTEVLAVGESARDPREITGRSQQNKVVNFKGDFESIGSLVPVKIMKAHNNSLWGEALR